MPALPLTPAERAALRAYCQLAKGVVREWLRADNLTRDQAHRLLSDTLLTIVESVLPALPALRAH
mgnify:CR=1 FL=1